MDSNDRRRLGDWLILACVGLALISDGWTADAPQKSRPQKDFVWRVQSTNGVLFLAGSLHELRARDRPSASLYEAYALCDRIVFEVDLAEIGQEDFRREVTRLARLPPGKSLTKQLDAATVQKLRQLARRQSLPEDEFEQFRPWFASSYASLLLLSEAGFEAAHGTDQTFFDRAVREGKPRESLETGRQQLDMLVNLPERDGLAELRRDLTNGLAEAEALVQAWKTGDVEAMERLALEDRNASPSMYDRLLTARNAAWLPRLEHWLAGTNSTLVLVGAAHLVGTNGLVHLLERRGHSVRQMPLVR
ncbi:MAG TPA: TraB/GumN family protein [Verrucomicrobiota bacterium]|nr:TraB/GumN family protein [Verrucomicrobiota bacterium]